MQVAIANSLPTLEEIVSLVERSEEDAYVKEVERRRTRINAGTPQEVQNEVGRDIWGASKVSNSIIQGLELIPECLT
jgi:superkiller protein 3